MSDLDQSGTAACRSRIATMLRLMDAMTFDSMRSVRRTVTPGQSAADRIGRPVLIGTVELLPVSVAGMEARVSISVVPRKGWLAMRVEASCRPMLGVTVVEETVRSDLSNLLAPADGKTAAISALRRLLTLVSVRERNMAAAMEQGVNPESTDPGRAAADAHAERMQSLLLRAYDASDEYFGMNSVRFEFGNPYPVDEPADTEEGPFPISPDAMRWLEGEAPPLVNLEERTEGIATIYSFGTVSEQAMLNEGPDTMASIRIRAASRSAPEGVLNKGWETDSHWTA